jgi:hypothetical protein
MVKKQSPLLDQQTQNSTVDSPYGYGEEVKQGRYKTHISSHFAPSPQILTKTPSRGVKNQK